MDFSKFGVLVEDLEAKLGHPFSQATARELAELRSIHKAIADGQAKWADYVGKDEKPAQSSLKDKLKKTVEQDGADGGVSLPPSQQGSDAAPPFNPEVCPPPGPQHIDDETWTNFCEYVGDDPDRTKIGKKMKAKMSVGELSLLAPAGRKAVMLSIQDEAKRQGVAFSEWVKES